MQHHLHLVPSEDWYWEVEEAALWRALIAMLDEHLGMLGPRPLRVIIALYGLDGEEPQSHAEIAFDMGVTEAPSARSRRSPSVSCA